MKKRMLFVIAMVALMFYVPTVSAATIEVNDDTTLIDAFKNAENNDIIKLTSDIVHNDTFLQVDNGRTITLDLNGKTLKVDDKISTNRSLRVYNGKLTVKNGTISYKAHNAINVKGSETPKDDFSSKLIVEKDVTLEGLYGIAIFSETKKGAYGVTVDFAGKIEATEGGITVNGNVQQDNGAPVINLLDGAVINSTKTGIYAAGAGTWNLGNITVTGIDSAIGVKAGKITINGGTYTATGKKVELPKEYNDGINPSGATIQIEGNKEYYGNVELYINDGKFISKNYSNILEYIVTGDDTAVNKMEINGGTFTPNEKEPTLVLTGELTSKIPGIVSGGIYTGDISSVLKPGYKSYIDNEGNVLIKKIDVKEGTFKVMGKAIGATEGTVVQLKQGSKVLQVSVVDANGDYIFDKVAKGVYTLVLNGNFESISKYVEVTKDTTVDINALAPGNKIVFVGENAPDVAVKGLEKVSSNDDVVMIIGTDEEATDEHDAIKNEVKADNYDFIDILLSNNNDDITETNDVLMLALSYNLDGKTNIGVSRYHNDAVSTFTKLKEMPENDSEYKDGTFFIDEENNIIYIFANKFSSYAVTYDNPTVNNEVVNPKTGDSILNYVGIMFITVTILGTSVYFLRKKENN